MYMRWTNDPFMRHIPHMTSASEPLEWVWMRTLFYFEAYVFLPSLLPLLPRVEKDREPRAATEYHSASSKIPHSFSGCTQCTMVRPTPGYFHALLYLLSPSHPLYRYQNHIPVLNSLRCFRSGHRYALHGCYPLPPIDVVKRVRLGSQCLTTSRACRVLHPILSRTRVDCDRLGNENHEGTPGTRQVRGGEEISINR